MRNAFEFPRRLSSRDAMEKDQFTNIEKKTVTINGFRKYFTFQ